MCVYVLLIACKLHIVSRSVEHLQAQQTCHGHRLLEVSGVIKSVYGNSFSYVQVSQAIGSAKQYFAGMEACQGSLASWKPTGPSQTISYRAKKLKHAALHVVLCCMAYAKRYSPIQLRQSNVRSHSSKFVRHAQADVAAQCNVCTLQVIPLEEP